MKPILFNTDMVRAILEGRKTVTRRVVKPQPKEIYHDGTLYEVDGELFALTEGENGNLEQLISLYRPGDILYVRETWRVQSAHRFEADARIEFKAGGDMVKIQFPGRGDQYHSRREYDAFVARWADDRWRPSIHMPREAARIFLRVTEVRVERLQWCGNMEAKEEGCTSCSQFVRLWDSTIKHTDRPLYGWEANPWVWVIEFERISKEEAGLWVMS